MNKHEHKLSICTDRRFLKIHEFNSFISTNITVNKREQKQSICTDRRFLKIHEFNSFILPKTTVTLRTLYFLVFVHEFNSFILPDHGRLNARLFSGNKHLINQLIYTISTVSDGLAFTVQLLREFHLPKLI